PVPVWLGQGSTAGAVNIVTVSPTRSTSKKSKNKGRFKIRGGSYGTANASCTYTVPQDQGSIMLTTGGGHKDGKRPNSDRDSGNFSFNWSKKSQFQTKYDLNVRYYQTEHGSPGPTDNETPNARQKYRKGSLDFHTDGLIGDTGEFSMKWYADIKDLKDRADDGRISTLENCKYGMKGETIWSHEERGALRLGGLLEKNEVEHDISGDHHREKASLHLQHDREIYDFTISLGLRGEHSSDFGYFPAGNIGLSYAVGQNTLLKTNAGYSVEIPTFNQLYQPSHGSIDQVRGNPDLSEEEIYSYDLSLEHSFNKKTIFNATLFRTDTRDMITYLRDENLIYHPDNISRAYKQGVELFLTSKWQKNISLDLSYIYQNTENKETNKDLPYSPRHNAKLTGKFVLPTGTKIEAIFKALSRQYSSPGTVQSKKLDSYCVVNLKTIHPILIKSLPCEIFVHINNLFDTDFESHADYPDDGFRFIAGMNMNF
ncbi:MAG: TonB-dependent receptor, partial [Desulfobacterales bacterium]|nr:TonB-dependent receptor [Desulfobacterales bacterium]